MTDILQCMHCARISSHCEPRDQKCLRVSVSPAWTLDRRRRRLRACPILHRVHASSREGSLAHTGSHRHRRTRQVGLAVARAVVARANQARRWLRLAQAVNPRSWVVLQQAQQLRSGRIVQRKPIDPASDRQHRLVRRKLRVSTVIRQFREHTLPKLSLRAGAETDTYYRHITDTGILQGEGQGDRHTDTCSDMACSNADGS